MLTLPTAFCPSGSTIPVARTYNIRALKDVMSRETIEAFDQAGITIASATFDIVGFPSVQVKLADAVPGRPSARTTTNTGSG